MRARLGVAVAAAAVAAIAGASGGSGSSAEAGATTRERTVTDLPDDRSGPQVHFLYIVPSDGTDGQLDTNGQMEQSIIRIERWLATQTGDQGLRIDTYGGVSDITFVRLPHSDAQVASHPGSSNHLIGADLVGAGFSNPTKVYAAFYDGHSGRACGGAKSAALPTFGAMYLQAWPTNDARPCRDAPGFGTGTGRPGYFEIGLLHEILHVIGFAPSCARHVSDDPWRDHVNDSSNDLMYGPDDAHRGGWNWSRAVLDVNRDDYYRASVPGCRDLSDSPYLAALHAVSVAVSGPGTVTSEPAGIECPGSCTGRFQGSVTLTATPSANAVFQGWTGGCAGTAACVVAGAASATASFVFPEHRRSLSLRVRARRATGALRVADAYEACRRRAVVIVDRRGGKGWSVVRRARTDGAGRFTIPIPAGRATYRARAPETVVNDHTCVKAVSRTVGASG